MSLPGRTARPVAVIASILLAAGVSGCGGGQSFVSTPIDTPTLTPDSSAASTSSAAAASPTDQPAAGSASPAGTGGAAGPGAVASTSTGAGAASQQLVLKRTSADGSRTVALTATITGMVPPQKDATSGKVISPADTQVLGTELTWGDGQQDGSDPGDVQCAGKGAPVPLTALFPEQHSYLKPGTYTITFSTAACPPLGKISKTMTVAVR